MSNCVFDPKLLPAHQRMWYIIPDIIPEVMLDFYYRTDTIMEHNHEAFFHATGLAEVRSELMKVAENFSNFGHLGVRFSLENEIEDIFNKVYHERMKFNKGLDEVNIDFFDRFYEAYMKYSKFRLETVEALVKKHYPEIYAQYKVSRETFDSTKEGDPEFENRASVLYHETAGFTSLAMNLWNNYRNTYDNPGKDNGCPIVLFDHLIYSDFSHRELRQENGYYKM